ncbi:embryo-specific protein ATS3B-like [Corylus avellana]|uniref:embryo-specific protein ATS3B-like n=1 Tax=Corylus avellana TaxID=13451 RepID=UPI00286A974F|nr:embryo-specific protein ATS3B-like [Corylus avellana]
MIKTSILIIFIVSIIFPPAFGNKPNDQALQGPHRNCSYSVEIETTCAPSAETADHHLKNPKLIYAPKDGSKQQQGGGAYGGFQRCAIDMFEASGACMRQRVCSLYLKKVGSDDWRPGWVKVLHHQDPDDGGDAVPVSYMFYFRTFVPENVWYGFDYCHSRGGLMPHAAGFGG